jgi:glutaredoxin-like protein NrdH
MAKQFLTENNVAYEFVDVDLLEDDEREKARQAILSKSASISYPTIIVDNTVIAGFHKDKLKEALNV